MFNTFESTESRRKVFRKRREKKDRQEKQKELHTISIRIVSFTSWWTIKVDSRRLLKDLNDIIIKNDQTKRKKISWVFYNNKLLFKDGKPQFSNARDRETLTIADFFNITNKQLEDSGDTLALSIIFPPYKRSKHSQ
jgi:hypothetical protein|tara:strand:- start:995 stop:1405 length:411 start_codon:yes stop_codon:yes gene_type:complete